MVEGIEKLIELQELDDELIALEHEQGAIPERRAAIAEARAACEARLAESQASLKAAEASQRSAETELQDKEAEVKRLEGQTSQVKTNEAYTALLHEIDRARNGISECETRILEAMDAIESTHADLTEAERVAGEERDRFSGDEQSLDAREKELEVGIASLRDRREGLVAQIPDDVMRRYVKITARRRPALVKVSKERCAGCQVDIPPQDYIEILRGERIVACGHCHRILIHEQRLSELPPS